MGLESIIIGIHLIAAIAITALVLIQRGKGSEIGASFGSGASQTMFGTMGSGNFLTKSTTIMAILFFATSLGLAIIARQQADQTIQGESLLSGDIEQISSEIQRENNAANQQPVAPAQGDLPAAESVVEDDDLPVVGEDIPSADIPAADTGTDLPTAPDEDN